VLAAAARLEDGVPFYQIFDADVARRFDINLETMQNPIVFLKKDKFTLYGMYLRLKFRISLVFGLYRCWVVVYRYTEITCANCRVDGEFRAYDIARFVTGSAKTREESTIVWASIRAQESRIFYAFFNILFFFTVHVH
jgi:hypothetical protein